MKKDGKQRLTAFIDPNLVTRAKVRGALEGLTISEVVEKALDTYAPKIEKDSGHDISLKFVHDPVIDTFHSKMVAREKRIAPKQTKSFIVPR